MTKNKLTKDQKELKLLRKQVEFLTDQVRALGKLTEEMCEYMDREKILINEKLSRHEWDLKLYISSVFRIQDQDVVTRLSKLKK